MHPACKDTYRNPHPERDAPEDHLLRRTHQERFNKILISASFKAVHSFLSEQPFFLESSTTLHASCSQQIVIKWLFGMNTIFRFTPFLQKDLFWSELKNAVKLNTC